MDWNLSEFGRLLKNAEVGFFSDQPNGSVGISLGACPPASGKSFEFWKIRNFIAFKILWEQEITSRLVIIIDVIY